MEGLAGNPAPPERPRPPSHLRASSRSSTSTTSTRMTPQNANNSSSQKSGSPQLPAHQAHRFHHASGKPSGGQRTPQISREGSSESRHSAASTYLQEKLQRERKTDD